MAVYKRNYKPYEGRLTADWSRFLVPARYALQTLFQSRLLIGFLVASYLFPVFAAVLIYMHHNLGALAAMQINAGDLLPIDGDFFAAFLSVQSGFAFLLTAYAGPGLISPDLSNNALPLYLCRPISRTEYVLSKMAVLFIPLSCITWIPGLLLFSFQAGMQGGGWGWDHAHWAWAIFLGSWVWIVMLSLLAVALSAWVKWKLAASALLFGVFFIPSALGAMVNEVLVTRAGNILSLGYVIGMIWANLLKLPAKSTIFGELFNVRRGDEVPEYMAWTMVALVCGACILLLNRRLRAKEVVS
jgi:ABC-type transport system involved in multi-copper enzyme maturation permease subunit